MKYEVLGYFGLFSLMVLVEDTSSLMSSSQSE